MTQHRRTASWLVVLGTFVVFLLALALSGATCSQVGTRPSPTAPRPTRMTRPVRMTRPAPTRMTRPAPTRMTKPAPTRVTPTGQTTSNLRAPIDRTKADVASGDWTKAKKDATDIGSAWRPVRTNAIWPATDMAAFESSYTKLRTAISAKDKSAATSALTELSRLANKNQKTTAAAPSRAIRPAPTR